MFQTNNLSLNLYSFEDLVFFVNSQMTQEHIDSVKRFDPGYIPRTASSLNRTVVHRSSNTCLQLDIQFNLCDIVLPPNQSNFKTHMFRTIVNFMLKSIRESVPVNMANEIGFRLIFYAPAGTMAAQDDWWTETGITKMNWRRSPGTYRQTLMGVPLTCEYVQYSLLVQLDSNYKLIRNSMCFSCGRNMTGRMSGWNCSSNSNNNPSGNQMNTNATPAQGFQFGTTSTHTQGFQMGNANPTSGFQMGNNNVNTTNTTPTQRFQMGNNNVNATPAQGFQFGNNSGWGNNTSHSGQNTTSWSNSTNPWDSFKSTQTGQSNSGWGSVNKDLFGSGFGQWGTG
jgi:hypothetical protein